MWQCVSVGSCLVLGLKAKLTWTEWGEAWWPICTLLFLLSGETRRNLGTSDCLGTLNLGLSGNPKP